MPISEYLKSLREKVGHDLVVLPAVSVSIVDTDGRLLLGKDAEMGFWTLPGGAIDPKEYPADAAVRECFEETGLLVEIRGLIGVFGGPEFVVRYPNEDVGAYITIAFRADVTGESRGPGDGEMSELGYFSPAQCESMPLSTPTKLIAKATFSSAKRPYFQPASWKTDC
ncbi:MULTISPECIES: NUDIX domain-containing protein [unclassified Bradyrhizobium]|uniref:NUDIX domain-containing protein n=1 Tax=unclassified Bradyrhizobium TaxID=2631580 RepID=UPI0028EAE104|nr:MULTISPECIES: NUDIX domain-containing protein [unclassified Bradyrhizobium]